jgi:hypothetical protein
LHVFETAPNCPSLSDIASSWFPALMRLSGGPESSSVEPMSTQFSSPAMIHVSNCFKQIAGRGVSQNLPERIVADLNPA